MSVRPLEDRILIKPLDPETKTASGIYLPESAKEKPMQGKVVAIGPGKMLDNGERIQPSDIVFKRPGTGLHPDLKELVVGRTARCRIGVDQQLTWEMV